MPKNVIISEDGRGRRFPNVSRLITSSNNRIDSWVPTDERIIRQKYISKNGIYYAKDDEIYGFSKLTVNVPGGAQGYTVPTVASLPYGVEVATADPSQPMPIIPGTVGSSVVGIDPDTGLTSVMTVNPDGTLSKKLAPTSIRVLIPPAKLSYHEGDKIQYAGLVVELLDPNGDNFQDEIFPQGIISWSPVRNLLHPEYNLITPVENAELDDDGIPSMDKVYSFITTSEITLSYYSSGYKDYEHFYPVNISAHADRPCFGYVRVYSSDSEPASYGSAAHVFFASKEPFNMTERIDDWQSGGAAWSYTRDGRTVYYRNTGRSQAYHRYRDFTSNAPIRYDTRIETAYNDPGRTAWWICYGNVSGKVEIPVRWTSPYDGNTYEDTFEIKVRGSEGASNEGGSSEGGSSEGGGGGHSF